MKKKHFDAGSKARNDVTKILDSMGYVTIPLFNRTHNKFIRIIEMYIALHKAQNKMNNSDVLLVQYPYKPQVMDIIIRKINKIKKHKDCKFVLLIHDIAYLRNEKDIYTNADDMKKIEVQIFNYVDCLIVHNEKMKAELVHAGVKKKMLCLDLFDYIYDGKLADNDKENKTVVYAGNLSKNKSGFLYDAAMKNIDVDINLYGTNPDRVDTNLHYMGQYPPDKLIASLKGNYGLVWDGPSAKKCIGNYGEYLRYNNPHKCSLYLAAGLPAVVWDQSAIADYIVDNKLGFSISSLDELVNLPNINSIEYIQIKQNVMKFRERLSNGEMLKNVLSLIDNE